MKMIARLTFATAAISTVLWWRGCLTASPGEAHARAEASRRVVEHVAGLEGGGLRWHVAAMPNDANTQSAVSIFNMQDAVAQVSGGAVVSVETAAWAITLDLTRVTEI